MSIKAIGKQIAKLRKEHGITQEELASNVGVSTQAVSKWENGGVPDVELLPKIADFFSVSVDFLFERNITDNKELHSAINKKINTTAQESRFEEAFELCWDIERSFFGSAEAEKNFEEFKKLIPSHERLFSSVITDIGFTRMGIADNLRYFFLMPENENLQKALLEDIDYVTFFKDFSNKHLFDACVFLNTRNAGKAFTENLLVKKLNITFETAKEVISTLEKYQFISSTYIEMDDEIQTVYNFQPTPSFIAFLIFTKEIIVQPNNFCYYCTERKTPFFR